MNEGVREKMSVARGCCDTRANLTHAGSRSGLWRESGLRRCRVEDVRDTYPRDEATMGRVKAGRVKEINEEMGAGMKVIHRKHGWRKLHTV